MTVRSTSFSLNKIVQSRKKPEDPAPQKVSPTATSTKKTRTAARRSTTSQTKQAEQTKKVQGPRPSTAQPATQQKTIKRNIRKNSRQARPNPFGGSSARVSRVKRVAIKTGQQTQTGIKSAPTTPKHHKKITIG